MGEMRTYKVIQPGDEVDALLRRLHAEKGVDVGEPHDDLVEIAGTNTEIETRLDQLDPNWRRYLERLPTAPGSE